MFRRRRPLMRAAVVGGGAYVAGKKVAQRSAEQGQQENEQDERLATLEDQAPATTDPPAQDAPAAAPSMPDQLNQLADLHEKGALTDDERREAAREGRALSRTDPAGGEQDRRGLRALQEIREGPPEVGLPAAGPRSRRPPGRRRNA